MSSRWGDSHRKGMYSQLNNTLKIWSDVIFFQAPYSIIVNLLYKFIGYKKYSRSEGNDSDGLHLFTPIVVFHNKIWNKIPITLKIDSWLFHRQTARYLRRYQKNKKVIFWACHPFDYHVAIKTKPAVSIYDYYDNFSFDEDGELNVLKDGLNRKLIEYCNLIFTTSVTMQSFAKTVGKDSHLIPNGFTHSNDMEALTNVFPKGAKIIGYLGNIRDWIDFELIKKLLTSLDDTEYLAFVGPVSKNVLHIVEDLKKNKKFIHIEAVDYRNIMGYIKSFDIGIIPFKRNKFTDGVFPNKFFEYIAGNIRIVSTNLPDLCVFRDSINVASNCEDFIRLCKSDVSLLNFDTEIYSRIMKESNWENRICEIEKVLLKEMNDLNL